MASEPVVDDCAPGASSGWESFRRIRNVDRSRAATLSCSTPITQTNKDLTGDEYAVALTIAETVLYYKKAVEALEATS